MKMMMSNLMLTLQNIRIKQKKKKKKQNGLKWVSSADSNTGNLLDVL